MSKARDIADLDFNSPDIDGGNIDGATIGGTTPAAGSFTALTIDTMTLNASSITGTSNLTLDVAGNINLDADGGSVFFKDAGTEFFKIRNTGSDVQIYSARPDADMKFEGVDGSVGITALLLDMSAAGAATFNSTVTSTGLTANVPSGNGLLINSADISTIKMKANSGGVKNWGFAHTNLAAGDFGIYASNSNGGDPITAGAAKLYFTSTGAATFNSSVTVASTLFLSPEGSNDLIRSTGGVLYLKSNSLSVQNNSGVEFIGTSSAGTIFNNGSADLDFRVESNANSHMLFVDGGTNRVGIGTFSQGPRTLLELQGSEMPETGDAASVEDMLNLYRNGSASVWSGGATLALGRYSTGGGSAPKSRLDFKLKNAAGSNTALPETTVMSLQSQGAVGINTITPAAFLEVLDPTSGNFNGSIHVGGVGSNRRLVLEQAGVTSYNIGGTGASSITQFVSGGTAGIGSVRTIIDADGNLTHNKGAVFNESGATSDFRVETDAQSHMLYLSGGSNRLYIGGSDSHNSGDTVHLQQLNNRHGLGIVSHHSVSATGPAECVQGCFSCSTVSAGNKITIPITTQSNLWRRVTMEIMVQSSEYNQTVGNRGGTAAFTFAMLSYVNGIQQLRVDGNISSITASGANIEINFTTGFIGGLSNHEGCMVYYKILSDQPDYVQVWNAVLN